MAQPLAFSVGAALITLGLLYTARQSQDLLNTDDDTVTLPATAADGSEPSPDKRRPDSNGELTSHTEHAVRTDGAIAAETPPEPAALAPAGRQERHSTGRNQPQQIELTPGVVIANVAVTQGLIAGLVLVAGWYFAIPAEAFGITADPLSTGLPAVGVGVGFGGLLWVGNELSTRIADAVGAAYDESVRALLSPDSPVGWLLLFGGVLPLIAVSEELLFRAALIGVPAASFSVSPWALAVVASLAFALGHGAQGRVGVVVTGLLGFALATGYILTGSLLVVIVAHYVINAVEFFIHEYLDVF